MKRRGCIVALATGAALILLGIAWFWYEGTPNGAFRRHFDSLPDSVKEIRVEGHTALAGSNETLTFRISEEDLDQLIAHRGFSDVTDVIQNEIVRKGTTHNEGASIAYSERDRAISYGVTPKRYYAITKFDGLVYYILITSEDSDLVYYHYYKT